MGLQVESLCGNTSHATNFTMLLVWTGVVLIIATAHVAALDKKIEDAENLVISLSKKSNVDIKKSFRCGMFFPDPKDPKGLPAGPQYDKYNNFCNEIFRKFTTTLTLSDPSLRRDRRAEGSTIGNDICRYIKERVKAPFVGGRKSKKFP